MRLSTKLVVAAVALGVLSSPSATATVLTHTQDAVASVRDEVRAELAGTDRDSGRPQVSTISETARPAARGARSYAFTVRDHKGRPGRWNPCQTIPVIVNPRNAPAGAMADLKTAVAHVNAASGLRFRITGTTTASASSSWGTVAWSGSPQTWAPVLIAFGRPGTGDLTADGSSGVTSPVWVTDGGHEIFVSGSIVFNSDQNKLYRPGFGSGMRRGPLFEHELGHLAGLDHVNDRRQVMYPQVGWAPGYAAGDTAGLRALGAGGCLRTPTPDWAD